MGIFGFRKKNDLPKDSSVEDITPKELGIDVKELKISVEDSSYTVYVNGNNAKDFLVSSEDLAFSYISFGHKDRGGLFAPSVRKAIAYFNGERPPTLQGDYYHWGKPLIIKCHFCNTEKRLPIKIDQLERLVVYRMVPDYREVIGWRVSQVKCELGKGIPYTKVLYGGQYNWDFDTEKKRVCQKCADRLKELGRKEELLHFSIL